MIVTATEAVAAAAELQRMAERDRRRIGSARRATASALAVHHALLGHPVATSGGLVKKIGLTPATVNKSLELLRQLDIVQELTRKRRNRIFSYRRCLDILNRSTELT